MADYRVSFYQGDYPHRQRDANAQGAICYVEQHFNSCGTPSANYALAVVASNSSSRSQLWGNWYSKEVGKEFGIPCNGVKVAKRGDRGYGNLCYASMPAVLLEPFFISNADGGQWARSDDHRQKLARILANSIREFFPNGGLVAFSVGHRYKTSQPNDQGAACLGGGTEAQYAELVLRTAGDLLQTDANEPAAEAAPDEPIPVDEASGWAQEAVEWAIAEGISDGSRPREAMTREEACTMLYRLYRSLNA